MPGAPDLAKPILGRNSKFPSPFLFCLFTDGGGLFSSENQAVDAPVFIPDTFFNSVTNFDPDFQADTFSYLANALVLGGKPFREMCEINAEVCLSRILP